MNEERMEEDDNMENEVSDSSDSDSDNDKELTSRAEALEAQISSNKYLYDAHVEVTAIYLQMGDLDSMRAAFQRFHETFPLTPKLWLSWIKAEIKIASTSEEKARIFQLFDKAVEDYLSIDVWVEYAQFSIGASELSKTHSILERGLNSAGLHVAEGSLLWDTLRELEHAHVQVNSEGSEEWKNQVNRLADVFKRQLSVPLLNMENTYQEWQDWFKSLPPGIVNPDPIEWGYKKALKVLENYKPFEERLLIAESTERLEIYKEYIKVLKDPSTILCLYERAVVDLCLTAQLWEDYCGFAFKLGDIADQVSARALRHCDWSVELWCTRLRILENLKRDEKEIVECFEEGLTRCSAVPNLDLWLTFLEYQVRNCGDSDKLDKLFRQAEEQITDETDPARKLSRWRARMLAKGADMGRTRKIWNDIVHGRHHKGTASVWLEYARLEIQYGDPNSARTVFRRALAACKDWPQYIAEEWSMFERENGTLEDVMKCLEACSVVKKVEEERQESGREVEEVAESREERVRKRKFEPREKTRIGHAKRSKMDEVVEHKPNLLHAPPKKPIEKDPKITVFVSNLHPRVTERDLKELFPNAVNIDVVLDRKGKSRCFGYVQFAKEEETLVALARDRAPIDGRPVFVSEIKPERTERQPVFKHRLRGIRHPRGGQKSPSRPGPDHRRGAGHHGGGERPAAAQGQASGAGGEGGRGRGGIRGAVEEREEPAAGAGVDGAEGGTGEGGR
ncbi:unnamed protein product [Phaedon cochleariae]|uniref:RRM domain-containing protein n=1 Tax=Phaedon cochleariae TaxID=80249 RepID=A0A9N9SKA6_PHACE|nr:unnamed protein product [Phaedon cochleariae]